MKKIITIVVAVIVVAGIVFFAVQNSKKIEIPQKKTKNMERERQTQTGTVPMSSKYDGVWVDTTIEEQNENHLSMSFPVVENEKINADVKAFSEQFKADFLRDVEDDKQLQNSLQKAQSSEKEDAPAEVVSHLEYTQHFDVLLSDKNYFIFLIERYVSYGNTSEDKIDTLIYDKNTGQRIELSDMFNEDFLPVVSDLSRKKLKEKIDVEAENLGENTSQQAKDEYKERFIEMIDEGTKPTAKNFDSISFEQAGVLTIYFDKYQVGPGSSGAQTIAISLQEIEKTIKPEFKPVLLPKQNGAAETVKEDATKKTEEKPQKDTRKNRKKVDCAVEKCVALTFDDGPSVHTARLLDILKENDVVATFFVLGKSANIQGETVVREVAEGHEIGNHTWDHKDLKKLSATAVREQVQKTNDIVFENAAVKPVVFRPPYGSFLGETKKQIDMPIILWSVDPQDWKKPGVDAVIKRMTVAQKGDIILAHDIHKSTVDATDAVIKKLKAEGFVFVTVSELLGEEMKRGKVYGKGWG